MADPTSRRESPAIEAHDIDAVRNQLGRPPRGMRAVAHRCPCGTPDVVVTDPRLPDGTPFPTTYYLTCPKLTGAVSTLEAQGVMRTMQNSLAEDAELAAQYRRAHESYLADRTALAGAASADDPNVILDEVPEIVGISAGGMPDRVKCLHVLVAHALAAGPGVNPFGDAALELLREADAYPQRGSCVEVGSA